MEHIIIETLANGLLRLTPEAGYLLFHDITGRTYPEAIVASTRGFRAIPEAPHERTLDDAKREAVQRLNYFALQDKYLTLYGRHIWAGPDKRANLKNAAEALKAQGVESVQYEGITIPTNTALQILSAVEAYAALHTIQEERHKAYINSLQTIEGVDSYDFTTGYPEHLTFNLQ